MLFRLDSDLIPPPKNSAGRPALLFRQTRHKTRGGRPPLPPPQTPPQSTAGRQHGGQAFPSCRRHPFRTWKEKGVASKAEEPRFERTEPPAPAYARYTRFT